MKCHAFYEVSLGFGMQKKWIWWLESQQEKLWRNIWGQGNKFENGQTEKSTQGQQVTRASVSKLGMYASFICMLMSHFIIGDKDCCYPAF